VVPQNILFSPQTESPAASAFSGTVQVQVDRHLTGTGAGVTGFSKQYCGFLLIS